MIGILCGQVIEKIDSGYRLPPPPGCPLLVYQLMIQCWYVIRETTEQVPHKTKLSHIIVNYFRVLQYLLLRWGKTYSRMSHKTKNFRLVYLCVVFMHTCNCFSAVRLPCMSYYIESPRNSEMHSRPTFMDIDLWLWQSTDLLLKILDEAHLTHPQAGTLGAPLEAGENMYIDLQKTYT